MQKANDDMADFVKSGRAAPVENAWAPHTFYWKSGDPDLTDSQWTMQSELPINLPVEIKEKDIKTILGKMSPEESNALITIPTETNETNPEKMDWHLIDLDLRQGLEGDPEHSTKVANRLSFDEQGVQSSFDSETANVDSVGPLNKMTDDELKQALFKDHKLVEKMDLGRKSPEDFLNETLAEMGN